MPISAGGIALRFVDNPSSFDWKSIDTCLGPNISITPILPATWRGEDAHDQNLVIKISYKNRHILFTGDANGALLENVLSVEENKIALQNIDCILSPHHGSNDTSEFSWFHHVLREITHPMPPLLTIISSDASGPHFLPWTEMLRTKCDRTDSTALHYISKHTITVRGNLIPVSNPPQAGSSEKPKKARPKYMSRTEEVLQPIFTTSDSIAGYYKIKITDDGDLFFYDGEGKNKPALFCSVNPYHEAAFRKGLSCAIDAYALDRSLGVRTAAIPAMRNFLDRCKTNLGTLNPKKYGNVCDIILNTLPFREAECCNAEWISFLYNGYAQQPADYGKSKIRLIPDEDFTGWPIIWSPLPELIRKLFGSNTENYRLYRIALKDLNRQMFSAQSILLNIPIIEIIESEDGNSVNIFRPNTLRTNLWCDKETETIPAMQDRIQTTLKKYPSTIIYYKNGSHYQRIKKIKHIQTAEPFIEPSTLPLEPKTSANIQSRLSGTNYALGDVPGDGDCGVWSILYNSIQETTRLHIQELRTQTSETIIRPFLCGLQDDEEDLLLEQANRMETMGRYLDVLDFHPIAFYMKQHIVVIVENNNNWTYYSFNNPHAVENEPFGAPIDDHPTAENSVHKILQRYPYAKFIYGNFYGDARPGSDIVGHFQPIVRNATHTDIWEEEEEGLFSRPRKRPKLF